MADGRSGGGRSIVIILVVVAVLALIAYALGLFNVDTSGDLEAPDVDVTATGGELPNVQVEGADIDVGTTTETVKVPDVDVTTTEEQIKLPDVDIQPAGDDGSTKK
jgi:flagellar basal body-associated protein FliL